MEDFWAFSHHAGSKSFGENCEFLGRGVGSGMWRLGFHIFEPRMFDFFYTPTYSASGGWRIFWMAFHFASSPWCCWRREDIAGCGCRKWPQYEMVATCGICLQSPYFNLTVRDVALVGKTPKIPVISKCKGNTQGEDWEVDFFLGANLTKMSLELEFQKIARRFRMRIETVLDWCFFFERLQGWTQIRGWNICENSIWKWKDEMKKCWNFLISWVIGISLFEDGWVLLILFKERFKSRFIVAQVKEQRTTDLSAFKWTLYSLWTNITPPRKQTSNMTTVAGKSHHEWVGHIFPFENGVIFPWDYRHGLSWTSGVLTVASSGPLSEELLGYGPCLLGIWKPKAPDDLKKRIIKSKSINGCFQK